MISLGPTSDIIVAALLAMGQLITPVPDANVAEAVKAAQERNSCSAFKEQKAEYDGNNCESLKDNKRKYKAKCQGLENDMNLNEVQCATDGDVAKVLQFKPKPVTEYLKLNNRELVEELHTICYALQDRVFLENDEWMRGMTANRDDLAGKLVILQNDGTDNMMAKILQEAAEGNFQAQAAYNTVSALCHWKVNRDAAAENIFGVNDGVAIDPHRRGTGLRVL